MQLYFVCRRGLLQAKQIRRNKERILKMPPLSNTLVPLLPIISFLVFAIAIVVILRGTWSLRIKIVIRIKVRIKVRIRINIRISNEFFVFTILVIPLNAAPTISIGINICSKISVSFISSISIGISIGIGFISSISIDISIDIKTKGISIISSNRSALFQPLV